MRGLEFVLGISENEPVVLGMLLARLYEFGKVSWHLEHMSGRRCFLGWTSFWGVTSNLNRLVQCDAEKLLRRVLTSVP